MARYTARVELHDAYDDDYAKLHKDMATEGFSRFIKADSDTQWYRLPPAEYNRETDDDVDEVLAAAERAAAKSKKSYEILVTKSGGRRWTGLTPVKK